MARGASARWGKQKEDSPDTDSEDDSPAKTRPAHLDESGREAVQWSRNPGRSTKKIKKKKKKKTKSVDSASEEPGDSSPAPVAWSRNSSKGANIATTKTASDEPADVPKPRKKKKKKKKDVAYEWSRVPSSKKLGQEASSDDDEETLSLSSSHGPDAKPTKTASDKLDNGSKPRKEKKKKKRDIAYEWSRVPSSKKLGQEASSDDDEATLSLSSSQGPDAKTTKTASDKLDNGSKPRKKKKKKKKRDIAYEWSRVPSSNKLGQDADNSSNHSRKSVTSSSNHNEPIKKTKSTRSVDSTGKKKLDRSTRSASSRNRIRKAMSTRNVDSTGSDRSTRSTSSRSKGLRKYKSARSVDSAGTHSLDRSFKSSARRKSPRRVKSTESVDSDKEPSNHSRKPPKKTKSSKSMESSSSHKRRAMPKYSRNVDMMGNISNHGAPESHEQMEELSEDQLGTLSKKGIIPKTIQHITADNHFDDVSDHSDSDDESQERPIHDDKSLDESISHSQEEEEEEEEEEQPQSKHAAQRQIEDDSQSSTEVDYVEESPLPKRRIIPKGRQAEPVRVDFTGQILPASSHESKQSASSRKSDASWVASRLRQELEEQSRSSFAEDVSENFEDPAVRGSIMSVASIDQQKQLQSMLQDLEKFEANLMEEQNTLELAKQSLESRVFEQVQRQEMLKAMLEELDETYRRLNAKFPYPVEEILARREELQTENQVLKLRLKRQEDTLKKYQQPKMRNKNREIFRVSEVMMVSTSSIPQSSSASQMKSELVGLRAQIREKNETIEEQRVQRDELKASMEKSRQEVSGGDAIQKMQARVAELEKEKEEFMKEITRLQKEGRELEAQRRSGSSRGFQRAVSLEEKEDKADMADMKSILDSERDLTVDDDEQNQDVGFFGWLFGAQQSGTE